MKRERKRYKMRVLSQEEIDSLLSKILNNPTVLPNTPNDNKNENSDEMKNRNANKSTV